MQSQWNRGNMVVAEEQFAKLIVELSDKISELNDADEKHVVSPHSLDECYLNIISLSSSIIPNNESMNKLFNTVIDRLNCVMDDDCTDAYYYLAWKVKARLALLNLSANEVNVAKKLIAEAKHAYQCIRTLKSVCQSDAFCRMQSLEADRDAGLASFLNFDECAELYYQSAIDLLNLIEDPSPNDLRELANIKVSLGDLQTSNRASVKAQEQYEQAADIVDRLNSEVKSPQDDVFVNTCRKRKATSFQPGSGGMFALIKRNQEKLEEPDYKSLLNRITLKRGRCE